MELFIFARFYAQAGRETIVEKAIRKVVPPSRAEPGCVSINGFRSKRDSRLFYIYSCWADEAAFEIHAVLPHTVEFVKEVEPLLDHQLDITRATVFA